MLTEKGRALKPIMADISIRMNERILGSLTEDEADQLEVLLAKAVRTYGPAADETGKEGGGCTCSLEPVAAFHSNARSSAVSFRAPA